MPDYTNYTNKEQQAVAIAQLIRPGQTVIVGTGIPLLGSSLARRVYAPDCHPVVEAGLMDCAPLEVPRSVGEQRNAAHCAVQWPNYYYLGFETNEWLHGTDRLISFIGGAQIDPYGNVNSTAIGDYFQPTTRFCGSGGANGIATFSNTIITMNLEPRRFVEKVDYITSPGWIDGPGGRARVGLPADRGPVAVVTNYGVMKFDDETKRMYLASYFPTTTPEEAKAQCGFELDVSRAVRMDPPSPEIIRIIREELDPDHVFIPIPKEEA